MTNNNNLRLVNSRGRVLLEVTEAKTLAYGAIEYTWFVRPDRYRKFSMLCRGFYDSKFAFAIGRRDHSGSLEWWIENIKQDNPSAKLVGELPTPEGK